SAPADLTVSVTEFAPLAGQVAVYGGASCGTAVFLGNNGSYGPNKVVPLGQQPAGAYFIFVSNDGEMNLTELYSLEVQAE
ncbi:MAG: hypothetical protein ACRDHL_06195, partial [Candidatus Promineifilaceae bacterium]